MAAIRKSIGVAALIAVALSGILTAGEPEGESWTFAQVCDTQIENPTHLLQYQEAIQAINASPAELVLICGDLVSGPGNVEQNLWFKEATERFDIPAHITVGNHDTDNTPRPNLLAFCRERYGPDYYSFVHRNVFFLCLNSNILAAESVPEEVARQWEWLTTHLEENLGGEKREKYAHVIVFMHHPPFIVTADEPDQYFNIESGTRQRLLDLFKRYSVSAVLTGHLHRNNVAEYAGMQFVTGDSTAFTFTPDDGLGYRVWTVTPDALTHEYLQIDTKQAETIGGMAAALRPEVDASTFRQTRQAAVEMDLHNTLAETLQVDFQWTDTKGWRIEPLRREVEIAPGEKEALRFDVVAPEQASLASYPTYEASITAGAFFCGPLTGSLQLVSEIVCPPKGSPSQLPTRPRRLVRGAPPENDADCLAEVTAAYDTEGIEFTFSVRDEKILIGQSEEPFTGDAAHLSLFTGKATAPHPWTLALSVRPGADGPLVTLYPPGANVVTGATRTDGGYRITATVPFAAIGVDGPEKADAIRCEVGVVDVDAEGEEPTVLYWSGSTVPFNKVGEYGQLTLTGSPAK